MLSYLMSNLRPSSLISRDSSLANISYWREFADRWRCIQNHGALGLMGACYFKRQEGVKWLLKQECSSGGSEISLSGITFPLQVRAHGEITRYVGEISYTGRVYLDQQDLGELCTDDLLQQKSSHIRNTRRGMEPPSCGLRYLCIYIFAV